MSVRFARLSRKEHAATVEIARRYLALIPDDHPKVTMKDIMMDLSAVHFHTPLRLEELADEADDFDLVHDVVLIRAHLLRSALRRPRRGLIMRKPTGGPAFPRPASEYTAGGTLGDGNDAIREQGGMYLRQWYAGQALPGLLANGSHVLDHVIQGTSIAQAAFAIADAMIRHELEGK
jgi:hypothetical protein